MLPGFLLTSEIISYVFSFVNSFVKKANYVKIVKMCVSIMIIDGFIIMQEQK